MSSYFMLLLYSGPTCFEDSQNTTWDKKAISETLTDYIQKFKIDSVSRFLNHIFRALECIVIQQFFLLAYNF